MAAETLRRDSQLSEGANSNLIVGSESSMTSLARKGNCSRLGTVGGAGVARRTFLRLATNARNS